MEKINEYVAKQQQEVCAFIYDLNSLTEHVQSLLNPLPEAVQFYYAIKANSDEQVLRALLPHVYGFEVASMGEIEKVRAVSETVPIAFGGPGKTITELTAALAHNVTLYHLESQLQMQRLNWLAQEQGKTVEVLLRVNPSFALPDATLQMAGKATQFGIEQSELEGMLSELSRYPNLRVVGFHFHCISNNLQENTQIKAIEKYITTALQWQQQYDLELSTVNVGGGIGVTYQEQQRPFDWSSYCEQLSALLKRFPELNIAMECGRFVSAYCGVYLAEVTDVKRNHGENFAVLRGGNHHFRLPSSWQHNHPFRVLAREEWPYPFTRPELNDAPVTLCGELCTPKDVLAKGVVVERLRAGDIIVFEKAGAYGWHISHHDFLSHPHPQRVYL
ncbi:diaminopimelate decarboxylase [Pseudoalteromonas amylolytica]|uniref:Diaminopimelate decarboxylase n=1 Tax=Pseudoalteromonas amylolytica TaxID=1859457 RepID=A0A1S1MLK6_9GAMM|nr:diaminopimelate decarboxylase [Pseudoalteromonas sp. JW3]OHU88403.1 diaminopimelate decarboxylase [Pseudoalteromonas amylolytica]